MALIQNYASRMPQRQWTRTTWPKGWNMRVEMPSDWSKTKRQSILVKLDKLIPHVARGLFAVREREYWTDLNYTDTKQLGQKIKQLWPQCQIRITPSNRRLNEYDASKQIDHRILHLPPRSWLKTYNLQNIQPMQSVQHYAENNQPLWRISVALPTDAVYEVSVKELAKLRNLIINKVMRDYPFNANLPIEPGDIKDALNWDVRGTYWKIVGLKQRIKRLNEYILVFVETHSHWNERQRRWQEV